MSFQYTAFRIPGISLLFRTISIAFLAASKNIWRKPAKIGPSVHRSILITIAGLFHGLAYFSFPTVLILPVLKHRLTKKSEVTVNSMDLFFCPYSRHSSFC
jgi:hypothetical protein